MSPTDISTIVASTTDAIGSALTPSLGTVLLIFAALTGLGIALHYVRRYIGRKG